MKNTDVHVSVKTFIPSHHWRAGGLEGGERKPMEPKPASSVGNVDRCICSPDEGCGGMNHEYMIHTTQMQSAPVSVTHSQRNKSMNLLINKKYIPTTTPTNTTATTTNTTTTTTTPYTTTATTTTNNEQ